MFKALSTIEQSQLEAASESCSKFQLEVSLMRSVMYFIWYFSQSAASLE